MDAWNILYLAQNSRRMLPDGHQVLVKSPGGRDHDRFDRWLRNHIAKPHPWVRDIQVHYEPTLIEQNRADENAWITFVVDSSQREPELIKILKNSKSTYSTDRWTVIQEKSLDDALK